MVLSYSQLSLIAVALITLFMILCIISLRIKLTISQRHQDLFQQTWNPIFNGVALQSLPKNIALPNLDSRDYPLFIHSWLNLQETISGEGKIRLNALARRLGMHKYAQQNLNKSKIRQRMIAVVFLGRLRDRLSWTPLEKLMHNENILLSMLAARSLLEIDQIRAFPLVFSELIRREDWPEIRVALLLRSVLVPELVTRHLFDVLLGCNDTQATKLLPYLELMYNEEKNRILRILLERSQSDLLTSRLLKHIDGIEEIDMVRHYTGHARWHIRMQAIAALGRIGQREDLPTLMQGLSDEEWWVRYRAAQSLVKISGMNREELAMILENLQDPFAVTMLKHAIAEEERRLG